MQTHSLVLTWLGSFQKACAARVCGRCSQLLLIVRPLSPHQPPPRIKSASKHMPHSPRSARARLACQAGESALVTQPSSCSHHCGPGLRVRARCKPGTSIEAAPIGVARQHTRKSSRTCSSLVHNLPLIPLHHPTTHVLTHLEMQGLSLEGKPHKGNHEAAFYEECCPPAQGGCYETPSDVTEGKANGDAQVEGGEPLGLGRWGRIVVCGGGGMFMPPQSSQMQVIC